MRNRVQRKLLRLWCIGIWTWFTRRRCARSDRRNWPNGAKSIELAGKEMVEGIPAWHVQVRSKYDALLDFWIDVARPTRVLKHASGRNFVVSKYDDANPRDPIPTEATMMDFRTGSPSSGTR